MTAAAAATGGRSGRPARKHRDGRLMAVVLWVLCVMTVAVLVDDYLKLQAEQQALAAESAAALPAATPDAAPAQQPAPTDGAPVGVSQDAMVFDLRADGRLFATGAVTPGTADRFADELEKRGSYIDTIVLESPGGSVRDAIAIARLIRETGLATEVPAGGFCASSCPLIFAGGVDRLVGTRAVIGVHQVFTEPGQILSAAAGMDEAQRISADSQRLLVEMGVDPEVWIYAMETPKERLHYLTAEQLIDLRLATELIEG